MSNCFYCNGQMTKKRHPRFSQTVDHVYPQWLLRLWGRKSLEWIRLNKVLACRQCNNQKSGMHPVDWLIVMPGGEGEAKRFAALLQKLGAEGLDITTALAKRKIIA